jgi:DNA-binding NarL/FixJ family response regulator
LSAKLRALFIGDADHAEFRAAVASLASHARLERAADLLAGERLLAAGLRPDLIVLAQQRPGEIAAEAVERLRRLAPVAPVIALQSSWCEGEGRSGQPLPGVIRVVWQRFDADIVAGLLRLREGELADWAGPVTITSEERLMRRAEGPLPRGQGTVGILSSTYEARRLLADRCRAGGWSAVTLPWSTIAAAAEEGALEPCDVVVWDLNELPQNFDGELERLRRRLGGAEVVVLLAFSRDHQLSAAQTAGVAAVVGKHYSTAELLGEIARAASRRRVASEPK